MEIPRHSSSTKGRSGVQLSMRYGRAIKPQHSTNRRDSCVLSGILFLDLRSALMFLMPAHFGSATCRNSA